MKYFNRLCDWVDRIYVCAAVLFLLVVIAATSVQVFTRYVMGSALPGTEELSRYCFIWSSFLGAAVCVKNWSNAHVSALNDKLEGNWKRFHSTALDLLVIGVALILIVQGFKMVGTTRMQKSSMMRLPMCYVYASIPAGGIGMLLNAGYRILNRFLADGGEQV